jgi:RNA polymerase sigma-70 factor (ECF subfamily)
VTVKPVRGELVRLHPETQNEDLTDEGLVAACATADRAARALLFARHVDSVHRFVARMRGSDADSVEDIVQQTFLSAFQSAATFRGGNVRGWLYGIAANLVRNYARGEIRRKRALEAVADLDGLVARGPRDPMTQASLARIPEALAALPHDLRAAVVLVDLQGEKGSDAAHALGIPTGTLWRRVFHGRQALREALGIETDGPTRGTR